LANAGTVTWNGGTYGLDAYAGSVIDNTGTWSMPGNRTILDESGGGVHPLVVNTGTWAQTSGTGTGSCGCEFNNQGTLEVDAGSYSIGVQLDNYTASRKLLTGGDYLLTGALRVPNLDVASLAATVSLSGAGAALTDTSSVNALRDLAAISAAGQLSLLNGATLTTPGALTNNGAVNVGATSSTLTVTGAYTQSAGSTSLTDASSKLASAGVSLTGGAFTGVGAVSGGLTNTGATITPGVAGAPGTLSVIGAFTQSGAGQLAIPVSSAGHSELMVSGAASLGGTLRFTTTAGYLPATGTVLPLLTYTGRTGAFSPIAGADLPNATVYWLSDPGTELDATVQPGSVEQFATVTINGAAAETNSRTVTLTFSVSGGVSVAGMRIANDTDPTGAFSSYASPTTWTLGPIDGTRVVHAQLRDDLGNQSAVTTASIILDTTPPTATITPPSSPTGPITVSFDEPVTAATTSNVVVQVTGSGTNLPTSLTCQTSTGTTVDCATGSFTVAILQPTAPLLPAASYTATVNPTGVTPAVHDLAGNPAAATSLSFTG
jgi:hypothetical protein